MTRVSQYGAGPSEPDSVPSRPSHPRLLESASQTGKKRAERASKRGVWDANRPHLGCPAVVRFLDEPAHVTVGRRVLGVLEGEVNDEFTGGVEA